MKIANEHINAKISQRQPHKWQNRTTATRGKKCEKLNKSTQHIGIQQQILDNSNNKKKKKVELFRYLCWRERKIHFIYLEINNNLIIYRINICTAEMAGNEYRVVLCKFVERRCFPNVTDRRSTILCNNSFSLFSVP